MFSLQKHSKSDLKSAGMFPETSNNSQYLTEYGTTQQLVYFLIVHRKFEEACQLIFTKRMSASIFIHNVVSRCVRKNQVEELRSAIRKIGSGMVLRLCNE